MKAAFDSFNARNLRAQDVAATFIESDDFNRVCRNCHTIILGPRGSGKTTLLKMLTLPALQAWRESRSADMVLPFTSIYIPTDIVWHHQLLYSADTVTDAPTFYERASHGAVGISVMTSVVETFIDRIDLSFPDSKEKETELAELLIKGWKLNPTIPKLSQIHLELKSRTIELGGILNAARNSHNYDSLANQLPGWCDSGFLEATDFAITAFDSTFDQHRESRWALCFDELELAPDWLQEKLFKLARSTNQKLVFKLSSSPDPDILSLQQVKPSDDLDLVKLWRSSMVQRRSFCSALACSVMKRRGFGDKTPESLLGLSDESEIERASSEEKVKPYEPGSGEWELIRDVAAWDSSLADLLIRKGIDPKNPTANSTSDRDSILRKVKPIAALRKKFAKLNSKGKLARRTRKGAVAYIGVPAVYDISDGNPRRLIRTFEELCSAICSADAPSEAHISAKVQSRIVLEIAYLFQDYLKMLPGSRKTLKSSDITVDLFPLLREIGRYFSSGLLIGAFPLDPKSSFTVDESVSPEIVDLLRLASYHGAIVKVDASESGFSGELRGCRFRLCYTLSPLLQLPLRLYDPVALSTCLQNQGRFMKKRPLMPEQLALRIEHENH